MRRDACALVLPLALAALLALPASAAPAAPVLQQWTTSQGSHVLFIEEHALPMIDVEIDFHAGSAYDPPGKEGLAALVIDNLNDGTPQHDEQALARAFADAGAQLAGQADADRASLTLRTLSSAAQREPALDLLCELLHAPTFPQPAFERERTRSLSGLREALAQPDGLADQAFYPRMFPGHGYGRQPGEASLQAIARDDLALFWSTRYRAAGAVISLVGDLDRTAAQALAERLSAALPAGAAPDPLPPQSQPMVPGRIDIAHPAEQAHLLLGLPGFAFGDPDYVALMVANYVLGGGGFSSRLTEEVREKRGLVYNVNSQFVPQAQPGAFEISLQTRRDQAAQALALVRKVLDDFVAHGPTAAELKAAQQNLAGGFPLRLDSNRKLLAFAAMMGFYHLPDDWMQAYPRAIRTLTLAQVRDAVRRRLHPDQLLTVVVAGSPAADAPAGAVQ
ncbi:MAG: insulinase family protein [Pseudomonadota bacterium]|nr:insulinase family protein [Pseudomonadota bacterium]